MLVQQLKSLERKGFIKRQVYAEVPPRVEYPLTPSGEKVKPILHQMCAWGRENMGELIKN